MNNAFGAAFISSKLKVTFPIIGDFEICKLDILPSAKPLILTVNDKNGAGQEKFYVRSGNSSQELSLAEMPTYLAERFQK